MYVVRDIGSAGELVAIAPTLPAALKVLTLRHQRCLAQLRGNAEGATHIELVTGIVDAETGDPVLSYAHRPAGHISARAEAELAWDLQQVLLPQ